jgi:hypothetical protein
MADSSTPKRGLAIAAGLAFTAGAVVILFGDALWAPAQWAAYHYITLLTIFGTIAAGHLTVSAWRARHVSTAGFALLFLAGTALVVYQSVGRQAEVADTRASAVESRNALIDRKKADLIEARDRVQAAELQVSEEMAGRPDKNGRRTKASSCGKDCKDWQTRARDAMASVKALEADLASLGPPMTVSPKADRMAQLAAVFGGDFSKWKSALILVEPFLWTVFFELGSVVSLGFAFGHNRRVTPGITRTTVPATVATTVIADADNDLEPLPPKPNNRRRIATKAAAEADVIQLVARGEPIPSQDSLAERWGVHKGTVSRWVREFEDRGVIRRSVVGRCKMVAAA